MNFGAKLTVTTSLKLAQLAHSVFSSGPNLYLKMQEPDVKLSTMM